MNAEKEVQGLKTGTEEIRIRPKGIWRRLMIGVLFIAAGFQVLATGEIILELN